jgi:hypothetical protein
MGMLSWYLTLMEHRLNVFEKKMSRILGTKRQETRGCNEELHKLYSSQIIINVIIFRIPFDALTSRAEKKHRYNNSQSNIKSKIGKK